uniref:Uncharacterized protein n=1 Tax=Pseudo-nitzschia australis TaxID=44445 RepID=A0A7S4ELW1_9STRA
MPYEYEYPYGTNWFRSRCKAWSVCAGAFRNLCAGSMRNACTKHAVCSTRTVCAGNQQSFPPRNEHRASTIDAPYGHESQESHSSGTWEPGTPPGTRRRTTTTTTTRSRTNFPTRTVLGSSKTNSGGGNLEPSGVAFSVVLRKKPAGL